MKVEEMIVETVRKVKNKIYLTFIDGSATEASLLRS